MQMRAPLRAGRAKLWRAIFGDAVLRPMVLRSVVLRFVVPAGPVFALAVFGLGVFGLGVFGFAGRAMPDAIAAVPVTPPSFAASLPPGTQITPRPFAALPGWTKDAHEEAFSAFLVSCHAVIAKAPALRQGFPLPEALQKLCAKAVDYSALESSAFAPAPSPPVQSSRRLSRKAARDWFEAHFLPYEISPPRSTTTASPLPGALGASGPASGFLTAYYEPVLVASRRQNAAFPVPVLARPANLVPLAPGEQTPYPTRAQIWQGALAGQGLEIAWLRDKADLFITQVQGSARIEWVEGGTTRLVYAGRNGHPYTSIGKILVESGAIALPDMALETLLAWLRADTARGEAMMNHNASYVFFALDDTLSPDLGPVGGAGINLTAGRSLAVDRSVWPYGLPIYIVAAPLTPEGPRAPIERLMIAQDTGSAITGPARGDYFMGTGPQAGMRAGLVRDPARFFVLWPRREPEPQTSGKSLTPGKNPKP